MSSSPFSLAVGGTPVLARCFLAFNRLPSRDGCSGDAACNSVGAHPTIALRRARRAHARGGGAVSDPASCVIRDDRQRRQRQNKATPRPERQSNSLRVHSRISKARPTATESMPRFSGRSGSSNGTWTRPGSSRRVVRSRCSSSSDDSGFRYHAGYPLETPPRGQSFRRSKSRADPKRQGDALRAPRFLRRH